MTVYVDDVRHMFGRMVMCHMWADDVGELLTMADAIGVARKWIQGHPTLSHGKHRNASWVHFDVSLSCKARALELGAILTDKYGPVVHTKIQQIEWGCANGRPDVVERAVRMIESIWQLRANP